MMVSIAAYGISHVINRFGLSQRKRSKSKDLWQKTKRKEAFLQTRCIDVGYHSRFGAMATGI